MYLLGDAGGWKAQKTLWALLFRRDLVIAELDRKAVERCRAPMEKYHDLPMSLADATLIAVAEEREYKARFYLGFRVRHLSAARPRAN